MKESPLIQEFRCGKEPIVIRQATCVLTMDVDLDRVHDSMSPKTLGVQRDVDVVLKDGLIKSIGPRAGMVYEGQAHKEIDGRSCVIMPSMVDSFATPGYQRMAGLAMAYRSQGLSLVDMRKIGVSPNHLELAASFLSAEEFLFAMENFAVRAEQSGVGLQSFRIEAGADFENSLIQLEKFERACASWSNGVFPALCFGVLRPGALGIKSADQYLNEILGELPRIRLLAKNQVAQILDVEIDREQITKDQADRLLGAALQLGFDVSVQGDKGSRCGAAELAGALAERMGQTSQNRSGLRKARVLSMVGGQYSSESDLTRLARAGVSLVVTPGADFHREESLPDANRFRSSGVRIAIATGYNPLSSPIQNIWLGAYLALRNGRFSVPEVLAGVTREAAYALGRESQFGTIRPGAETYLLAFSGCEPEAFFNSPTGDHLCWVMRPEKRSNIDNGV